MSHENRTQADDWLLLSLNKLQVVLGVFVAFIAIAAAVGSWWVLPYRVSQAEQAIGELRVEIQDVKLSGEDNTKLLIRLDERLKTIQVALKIKIEPQP